MSLVTEICREALRELQVRDEGRTALRKARRLTLRRAAAICACALGIAREHRVLLALGVATGLMRAAVNIGYDWPWQYLVDEVMRRKDELTPEQFEACLVHFVGLWILFRWMHDHILTPSHDGIRVFVEAFSKGSLTLQVIDGLRHPDTPVEENLQSSVQSSRESVPAIGLALMSDGPKIVFGIGFFFYFLSLAPAAPLFALVTCAGFCCSGWVAYLTGQLSHLFEDKQGALDRFQKIEQGVHEHIKCSKTEVRFILVEQLRAALREYVKASIKAGLLFLASDRGREFVFDVTRIASLGCGAWYAYFGSLSFGAVIVLNGYVGNVAEAIGLASNLQKLLLEGQYFTDWYEKVTANGRSGC